MVSAMDTEQRESRLEALVQACVDLIESRFPGEVDRGAAAMLLADGTIVTGTSPTALNAAVEVCHESEPFCAAYRLDLAVVASVCLHRDPAGRFLVLSPCGVCRERLAVHGPEVLAAVPNSGDLTKVAWVSLGDLLPHYWLAAFPQELASMSGWRTVPATPPLVAPNAAEARLTGGSSA